MLWTGSRKINVKLKVLCLVKSEDTNLKTPSSKSAFDPTPKPSRSLKRVHIDIEEPLEI